MGSSERVEIGALLAGARHVVEVDRSVPVAPFEGFRFPEPVHLRVSVRSADGWLEIGGTLEGEAHGECDRCLGAATVPLHLTVDERFDPHSNDPFGEGNVLVGSRLDVADLAAQLVYSALPLGVLCSRECRGLCSVCGENKNDGACKCEPNEGAQGAGKTEKSTWRT